MKSASARFYAGLVPAYGWMQTYEFTKKFSLLLAVSWSRPRWEGSVRDASRRVTEYATPHLDLDLDVHASHTKKI